MEANASSLRPSKVCGARIIIPAEEQNKLEDYLEINFLTDKMPKDKLRKYKPRNRRFKTFPIRQKQFFLVVCYFQFTYQQLVKLSQKFPSAEYNYLPPAWQDAQNEFKLNTNLLPKKSRGRSKIKPENKENESLRKRALAEVSEGDEGERIDKFVLCEVEGGQKALKKSDFQNFASQILYTNPRMQNIILIGKEKEGDVENLVSQRIDDFAKKMFQRLDQFKQKIKLLVQNSEQKEEEEMDIRQRISQQTTLLDRFKFFEQYFFDRLNNIEEEMVEDVSVLKEEEKNGGEIQVKVEEMEEDVSVQKEEVKKEEN